MLYAVYVYSSYLTFKMGENLQVKIIMHSNYIARLVTVKPLWIVGNLLYENIFLGS